MYGTVYASSVSCRPLDTSISNTVNKLASLVGAELIGTWLLDKGTPSPFNIENLSDRLSLSPSLKAGSPSPSWNGSNINFTEDDFLTLNLKNHLEYDVHSSLEAYTIVVTFKFTTHAVSTQSTLVEMKGKERLILQITTSGTLKLKYELSGGTFGTLTGSTIPTGSFETIAFGFIRNKIDPTKSVVFMHSTKDASSRLTGTIIDSNFHYFN